MFKNRKIILNSIENNDSIDYWNKDKKPNLFIRLLKLIIWIIVIYSTIFYFWYEDFKKETLIENQIKIQIEKWDTIVNLAEKLNINEIYLKLYLKNNNSDFELKVWSFLIKDESNIDDILKSLETPLIENEVSITILEWWNIYDIDEYLTNKWLINKSEYIEYVTNKEKINALTEFFPFIKWLETLEWFLYPDTYTVLWNNFKINNFVIKQLDNF